MLKTLLNLKFLNTLKIFFVLIFCFISCKQEHNIKFDEKTEKEDINLNIDNWHKAAANADFNSYFDLMTEDAVFIGTDANENWDKTEFIAYSKPYFNAGKAWNFTSLRRHIYFSEEKNIAWFDELLETQMGICRGSGVLQKQGTQWKISHYVLSMSIPNEQAKDVVNQKKQTDNVLIEKFKNLDN